MSAGDSEHHEYNRYIAECNHLSADFPKTYKSAVLGLCLLKAPAMLPNRRRRLTFLPLANGVGSLFPGGPQCHVGSPVLSAAPKKTPDPLRLTPFSIYYTIVYTAATRPIMCR